MGTTTKGTRKYIGSDGHLWLDEGEYGQRKDGVWLARQPGGHLGNLSNHEVTEHEDGTITVSPSILISGGPNSNPWHGYLERGVWREA